MRNGETRKGANYICKSNPCNTQLLLYVFEQGPDLPERLFDAFFVGFERPRPEVQRLGVGFDLGRVGRLIVHAPNEATGVPYLSFLRALS